jgi:hypothetical protein
MSRRTWGEPRDRREEPQPQTAEGRQRLWTVAVSPTIWFMHFLACYLTASVWCARAGQTAALGGVRGAVAAYTALALTGIAVTGWHGYRRYRFAAAGPLHRDTGQDRHRFLGLASLLLSVLSVVAVLFVALPALFIQSCR